MPGVDARVGGRFAFVLPGVLALVACGGGGGGPHSPAPQIPSALLSTVTVTPGEGLDADGVDDAVVVITARDTNGHTISGLTVTIAASGSNNVVTQPPVVTNPMGATSGHVAATATANTIDGPGTKRTVAGPVSTGRRARDRFRVMPSAACIH